MSEALRITGSIDFVTANPSLGELYPKIGYPKEIVIVGGKYSEMHITAQIVDGTGGSRSRDVGSHRWILESGRSIERPFQHRGRFCQNRRNHSGPFNSRSTELGFR